jgi:hypothetical protein
MEENGLLQTHTTLFPDKEVLPLLITVAIK